LKKEAGEMSRTLQVLALAVAAGFLFLGGCGDEEAGAGPNIRQAGPPPAEQPPAETGDAPKTTTPPKDSGQPNLSNPLHAPGAYGTAVIKAPRLARKRAADATITREIQQFKALEGRYPKSLDELVEWRGEKLPALTWGEEYRYESKSGELSIVRTEE
jgi:hypothetical protein